VSDTSSFTVIANLFVLSLADGLKTEAIRGCNFQFDSVLTDVPTALAAARLFEQGIVFLSNL
jgi:hypothetical protein